MAMIRRLFTMTQEHSDKLDKLSGYNASGFLQAVIDKLWERSDGNAVNITEGQPIHSKRVSK